ncbi:MAG: type II 3-dehydroquinate dehydratase [Pseudomonadota bacterium]|nr:type II 3-dehydroquinate dehydratase [Pseudomonadota bacterium]
MAHLLLIHGPNLNLLGQREPTLYGAATLADINTRCARIAQDGGVAFSAFQSNAESALIDRIQAAGSDGTSIIVINPAAYTHTSVALRDALLAVGLPFVEVHLTNIHAREPFRHHSYFSDKAAGVVCGFGPVGYELATIAALRLLHAK